MVRNIWLLDEVARLLGMQAKRDTSSFNPPTRPLEQLKTACSVLRSDTLGEGSMREIANWAISCYKQLPDSSKMDFFEYLYEEYSVDSARLQQAISEWEESGQPKSLRKIFKFAEPPRQQLLRDLNHAEEGTYQIMQMRGDLRRLCKNSPIFPELDEDFRHLLASWFNPGFLTMEEIPRNTSKEKEEFLIEHERVHPMEGRSDLKQRLVPKDRKIFGFFHPAIGDIPLIFVEVALTKGVPTTIESILENQKSISPEAADTAVFYSINNAFEGLSGISFGSFLIGRVTSALRSSYSNLSEFVTFSPIPGFRKWLSQSTDSELKKLSIHLEKSLGSSGEVHSSALQDDEATVSSIGFAVAHYLANEKRSDLKPLDPVARFHLGNGASIWKIHWIGSYKSHSMRESFGAMVNYKYDPDEIEKNHELYVQNNRIPVSPEISKLLEHKPEN